MFVNVADRIPDTEAEGPGRRFALWVQGCPMRCPGCCNPEMLEFRPVEHVTVDDLSREISETPNIEGLTIVGGEPFSQAEALAEVCRIVREQDLGVMVFSGFYLEQICASDDPSWERFLGQIDLLVDGPFIESQRTNDRRWVGSENQRAHFLSDRYRHLAEQPAGWDKGRNTVEIRFVNGEIHVNGFPHHELGAEWKRED